MIFKFQVMHNYNHQIHLEFADLFRLLSLTQRQLMIERLSQVMGTALSFFLEVGLYYVLAKHSEIYFTDSKTHDRPSH